MGEERIWKVKQGISASIMCVDFMNMQKDIKEMEKAKIEYLHFDIMDGSFVPNYALGVGLIEQVRNATRIPLDIHMMVKHPESKLDYFSLKAGDTVSVHAESTVHLQRLLITLKEKGVYAGVAFNPATPIDTLEYVVDVVDFVLVMTVNPGFAGQKMVPLSLEKIRKVRSFLNEAGARDVIVQVDGNVSVENAKKMKRAGAGNFVVGTAGLFRRDMTITAAAERLRQAIL